MFIVNRGDFVVSALQELLFCRLYLRAVRVKLILWLLQPTVDVFHLYFTLFNLMLCLQVFFTDDFSAVA